MLPMRWRSGRGRGLRTAGRRRGPADFAAAVERCEARVVLTAGALDASYGDGGHVQTPIATLGTYAGDAVVQADGKTVVVGQARVNGTNQYRLAAARYDSTGALDASFGSGGKVFLTGFGNFLAQDAAVQADGKILVAGTAGGDLAVARLNADGSLDATFGAGGKALANFGSSDEGFAVAVQADGKIVVAGAAGDGNWNNFTFAVARFNADGGLDASFDGDGKAVVDLTGFADRAYDVVIADGKIVIAGEAYTSGVDSSFALARLNADGSLDAAFGSGGKTLLNFAGYADFVEAVALQADGKIVAAGAAYPGAGYDFAAARFNADGTVDSSFGAGGKTTIHFGVGSDFAHAVAVDPGGRIVLAGEARVSSGSSTVFALARLNADGGLDASFDGDGRSLDAGTAYGVARHVSIGGDGKLLVAGDANGPSGTDLTLARFEGTLYPTIDAAAAAVATNEGSPAAMTGTYTNAAGGAVTLSATSGVVTDLGNGAWSWAVTPADGPGDGRVVTVTITNAEGNVDSASFVLTVLNVAPTIVSLSGPATGVTGAALATTAAVTDPAGALDPLTYAWKVFRESGTVAYASQTGLGLSGFSFTPALAGSYTVQLTVTDGDGGGKTSSRTVTVGHADPKADLIVYTGSQWTVGVSSGTGFGQQDWGSESVDPATQPVRFGDVDGDGDTDVVVLKNGVWRLGRATGAAFSWGNGVAWSPAAYDNATLGDVNGDGRADAVARYGVNWYVSLAKADGSGFHAASAWGQSDPAHVGPDTKAFLTDVDGDGDADLLTFNAGVWRAGLSNAASQFAAPAVWAVWSAGANWQSVGVLRADADGRADIIGRVGDEWYVGKSSGSGFSTSQWGLWSAAAAWTDHQIGDFNGDGRDDIAARGTSSLTPGQWYVGLSTGTSFAASFWTGWANIAWANVTVGDYDGDGRDDLAAREGGNWWVARTNASGNVVTTLWTTGLSGVVLARSGRVAASAAPAPIAAPPAPASPSAASPSAASPSAAKAASRGVTDATIAPVAASDDPLTLFWSRSADDEEFAAGLLTGA